MISSTSTTSTSGVMLISDCRPAPDASPLNCISFPLCAGALGDQPYATKAGLLDCEHGLTDLEEIELCVASYDDFGILLGTHRSLEGLTEMLGRNGVIVNPQAAGLVDGD